MARQERMMFWTRPVADVREKNRLIEERCKGRLRKTWSESKEEVCDDAQVSGWADGDALVRMGYVVLQQQTPNLSGLIQQRFTSSCSISITD